MDMPLKDPQNHDLIWTDLLGGLDISSSSSWWQVITYLYYKEHGYSNYHKCLARNHEQVRQDVYLDKRIQKYLAEDDFEGSNKQKIERILNEMCHCLASQTNPSRRLKFAGTFFLKCITKVYSKIYVNNHLFPITGELEYEAGMFQKQYLAITKELPVVILPTHRSYMDFLFISYIMTQYELPLPIVATGDNFKSMGKLLTDYLKTTGSFLLRRTAASRTDVDANFYYDILRAYVHSVMKGGEHPMEFFMEGTRTRLGQVLRPKTGLLSMVVDMLIDNIVDDIYILPVAINYQRPIEEQLFIGENTPQINMRKPRESAKNLVSAFAAIMKRQYGKVYVRFFEPFKLSEYFEQWKQVTGNDSIMNGHRDEILHEFTNSLASKVCLEQANNSILMPFNLISTSVLARSFICNDASQSISLVNANSCTKDDLTEQIAQIKLPFERIVSDFTLIEDLLKSTQSKFVPGWQGHLEILDEFKLDRDGIVRASEDRKYILFNQDALTFQTMLYYSNQVTQVLLPVAICFAIQFEDSSLSQDELWAKFREIRSLLSYEFFVNESFMKQEFDVTLEALNQKGLKIGQETRRIIVKHLNYFVEANIKFANYMLAHYRLDKNEFFQDTGRVSKGLSSSLYVSKDMLKNMINLCNDQGALEVTYKEIPQIHGQARRRRARREEIVTLKNRNKMQELLIRLESVQVLTSTVILGQ